MGETNSISLGLSIIGVVVIAGSVLALPLKLLEKLDDGC